MDHDELQISREELKWKDFLLFVKKKYHKKAQIKDTSKFLRRLMGVTQEMINTDTARFSEYDYVVAMERELFPNMIVSPTPMVLC
jgi:hypothetical protein